MPFVSPYANIQVMLLNDRIDRPWITLEPLEFYSETTGDTYIVPKHFRHDGASVPASIVLIPVIGESLFLRFFGKGVFQGFREGTLHDWLRTPDNDGNFPVPASVAHLVFREALYDAGYPPDLCETYYAAVKTFNS